MADAAALDVNVDMGESFGRWQLGDDAAIMPFISSESIACGFHAGDPRTMRVTVHAAVEHELQIGAHVALPDLLGSAAGGWPSRPTTCTAMCSTRSAH
jgi:5-oxoprolinase (ATP-hydrolysing) subunit A